MTECWLIDYKVSGVNRKRDDQMPDASRIDGKSTAWIVLKSLRDSGSLTILNFTQISEKTGLDRNQVKSACHRLRAARLASYETGGSVGGGYNGAGYMITAEGERSLVDL